MAACCGRILLPWLSVCLHEQPSLNALDLVSPWEPLLGGLLSLLEDKLSPGWEFPHLTLFWVLQRAKDLTHEEVLRYVDSIAMEDPLRSNWRCAVGLLLCARRAATFSRENPGAISEILDRVISLLRSPVVSVPLERIPLGRRFSAELSELREVWTSFNTPGEIAEAQKQFSDRSVEFVFDLLQESAKMLGETPGNFGLLLLGSSSRQDRLPFSDIELALIYSADSENMIKMRVHVYLLMSIFDFLVSMLREYSIGRSRRHGFYIDASENLLLFPNFLIGTIDEIYKTKVEIPWITSPGFLVLFDDDEGKPEIFTSLLSTVLVNKNLWGGAGLFLEFNSKLQNFLNSKSDAWTRDALKSAFESQQPIADASRIFHSSAGVPNSDENSFQGILNRQLIALYFWMDVLRKAFEKTSDAVSELFSVKDTCHKPLTYLAMALRLFLDTRAVCAFDVFAEASKKGILPFPVSKLLQEMFFFSVSWRSRLHLAHGGQEEEINLAKISPEDRWAFLTIGEILHKPLLDALTAVFSSEQNYSENATWDFILREIFSRVWIHYCSKRDAWRENFSGHRLISELDFFPTPSGLRPAIDTWRGKQRKFLEKFLLPRDDPIFSAEPSPRVEVTLLSRRGNLVTLRLHPEAARELQTNGFLSAQAELLLSQEQVEKEKGRHLVMPVSLPTSENSRNSQKSEHSENSENSENSEKLTLYIKIFPEMPLLEIAVTEFATHLIGPCLPWITLVKIVAGGKSYPALLSEGITGKLISKNHPPSVDPFFFSLRVLLAVLLNQEDAKPSNIVCMPSENSGSFVLVSIDNDRSFYEAFHVNEEKNSWVPQVKDITFCFEDMNSPISPLAREIFLTLDPHLFLANWLRMTESETGQLETLLFTQAEKKAYFPQSGLSRQFSRVGRFLSQVAVPLESVLALLLPPGLIKNLYSKMNKLRKILISNPQTTHFDLLNAVEPYLAKYYGKILSFPGTPHDRFYRGFGVLYGNKNEQEFVTVSTTFRSLESLHGKEISVSVFKAGQQIQNYFSELEEIHKIEVLWRSVLAGFCSNSDTFRTSLRLFQTLPTDFQERVLNNLDFSEIQSRDLERALLNSLVTKSDFRNIRFRNSEVLSDTILGRILQNAPQLQGLSLVRWSILTPKFLETLSQCANLEKLFVSFINWSEITLPAGQTPRFGFWTLQISDTSVLDGTWQNLKVLILKTLPRLQSVTLPLVALERLHIFDCPVLQKISLKNSERLKSFVLAGCPSLDIPELQKILGNCPALEKLTLPDINTLKSIGNIWSPRYGFSLFVVRLKLLPPYSSLTESEKSEFFELYLDSPDLLDDSEILLAVLLAARHAGKKNFDNLPKLFQRAANHNLMELLYGFSVLLQPLNNFDISAGTIFGEYRKCLVQILKKKLILKIAPDTETLILVAKELVKFDNLAENKLAQISRSIVLNFLEYFDPMRNTPRSQLLSDLAFSEVCPLLPPPPLPLCVLLSLVPASPEP
jgi:hypothetical protein